MNGYPVFSAEEVLAATGADLVSGAKGPDRVSGVSIDSRTIQPGQLYVAIHGKRLNGHEFIGEALAQGAVGAIVDQWPLKMVPFPRVPGSSVEPGTRGNGTGCVWKVQDTLRALGDLARFHRQRFPVKVAAITGSAGKTTTKTMAAHLLADGESLLATPGTQNNQIGVPLTLFQITERISTVVLELGTNQWGEIRRLTEITQPAVGVITAIGQGHLETFGDLRGVLRAKGEMWEAIGRDKTMVLNAEDPLLWEAGRRLPQRVIWYGTRPEAQVRAEQIELDAWESRCWVNGQWKLTLPLPGRHNLMNALAALACVEALEGDLSSAVERLAGVPTVAGRLTRQALDGCTLIDDSYNANPTSLAAALEVFQKTECAGRRVAVIGDMLELGEQGPALHAQAGRRIAEAGFDLLITVGSLSRHLLEAAREAGVPTAVTWAFDDSEAAGEFVRKIIHPGDLILVKGSRGMQMEKILTCSTTSSIH